MPDALIVLLAPSAIFLANLYVLSVVYIVWLRPCVRLTSLTIPRQFRGVGGRGHLILLGALFVLSVLILGCGAALTAHEALALGTFSALGVGGVAIALPLALFVLFRRRVIGGLWRNAHVFEKSADLSAEHVFQVAVRQARSETRALLVGAAATLSHFFFLVSLFWWANDASMWMLAAFVPGLVLSVALEFLGIWLNSLLDPLARFLVVWSRLRSDANSLGGRILDGAQGWGWKLQPGSHLHGSAVERTDRVSTAIVWLARHFRRQARLYPNPLRRSFLQGSNQMVVAIAARIARFEDPHHEIMRALGPALNGRLPSVATNWGDPGALRLQPDSPRFVRNALVLAPLLWGVFQYFLSGW